MVPPPKTLGRVILRPIKLVQAREEIFQTISAAYPDEHNSVKLTGEKCKKSRQVDPKTSMNLKNVLLHLKSHDPIPHRNEA